MVKMDPPELVPPEPILGGHVTNRGVWSEEEKRS